jgi:hypothetical protein
MKLDHKWFNQQRMVLYMNLDPVKGEIIGMILYSSEYILGHDL